jgi:glutaconate CoA-transferase, subunit A
VAKFTSLAQAIAENVQNGDKVALEGFTHLIPFAAGHEIIRQGKRDLTLIRLTPDLIYDQLIGMGCVRKLIFSWGGNPGVGSLYRLRDAVENAWPQPLEIEEHSHAGLTNAYVAGAAGLPFATLKGYLGTDLPRYNSRIALINCPFTGEKVAAVPALNPDVTIIHAQQADRAGNVMLWGIVGVQKEAIMAAKRVIVTVEEIVESFQPRFNSVVLGHWLVTNIAHVPNGTFPSYAQDYSQRNNDFYQAWENISRERTTFQGWMEENVLQRSAVAF